ncbi:MAG: helix-turn-helix domain-containing protein [Lachnobacterium sp.]|nr:helix-turn-helix domain-containing protein [Lachnobacterium sp.]
MKYYNTAEVARELEIPRTTFYRWVKRGLIEPDKVLLSGKKQFSEDTVARLKKGEVICKN